MSITTLISQLDASSAEITEAVDAMKEAAQDLGVEFEETIVDFFDQTDHLLIHALNRKMISKIQGTEEIRVLEILDAVRDCIVENVRNRR
jgi:nucleotide-binding universal stress UspA family protein